MFEQKTGFDTWTSSCPGVCWCTGSGGNSETPSGRHLRWTLPTGIRWAPDPQRRSGVGWWKQSVPERHEAEARRWRWPGKLAWPSTEGQTSGAPGYLRVVKGGRLPCKFYTIPSFCGTATFFFRNWTIPPLLLWEFKQNLWFVVCFVFVFTVPPITNAPCWGLLLPLHVRDHMTGSRYITQQLKIHLAPAKFPRNGPRYSTAAGWLSTLPWQQTHSLTPIYHTPTDDMFTEHLAEDRPVSPLTARLTVWCLLRGERHQHVLIWLVALTLPQHFREGISGILPSSVGYFARLFKVSFIQPAHLVHPGNSWGHTCFVLGFFVSNPPFTGQHGWDEQLG